MAKGTRRKPTLPKKPLTILAICRFAEPVVLTSVFPYLPEMIESFNVPTEQVAKWAGLTSAVFSFSQCLTAIAWGRASDRFGRKPSILIGLTCTMVAAVLFGLSQSLPWALAVRSFQGLSNGNVGIIRTMVAELVPQKELQPRAFSIMPLVWTIGSIFGPVLGGALVYPADRFPLLFGNSEFFKKFPFALPNLLSASLFLVGIVVGVLFLKETLDIKKHQKDYGLVLGSLVTRSCSKRSRRKRWSISDGEDESDPFLADSSRSGSELSSPISKPRPKTQDKAPRFRDVFSPQSNINLAVYTLLAMHSVSFDQLLPIFMHHPIQSHHKNPAVHLPFKFAGGFGLGSGRIGALFTIYGVFGMFIQFFAFPPVARRYGVLNCLKVCSLVFPLVYIATPFTALLPTDASRQGGMVALILVKCCCGIFAFPCTTILLTNSAVSLRILGTLNGVATSISAIGRASGPALAGFAFSIGVDKGYVIVSWWTLAVIAMLGAIPVFWLVEMEGFTQNDDEDDNDEDGDSDALDLYDGDTNDHEPPAAETSGMDSDDALIIRAAPSTSESAIVDEPEDIVPDDLLGPPTGRSISRKDSQQQRTSSRRQSLDILRRVPSPIGMGPQGVVPHGARRYSSDLGATRSGFGAGGTSYH